MIINRTELESKHRIEFTLYRGAQARCCDMTPGSYGDRGIKFLFTSFEQFFAEVGPRPKGKYRCSGLSKWSLDRINNEGNYEPGNVRWATCSEQTNNRRKSRLAMSVDPRKKQRHLRLIEHLRSLGDISQPISA